MDILFVTFIIWTVVILLEWRSNYPLGVTKMVICPIPPFVKRIRIYDHKWIGFDENWKFILLKELEE